MLSSYCTLHPASHKTLIEMRDACARPGSICKIFSCFRIPSMSRSHVCVDLILDLSGILIEIGLSAG